MLAPNPHILRLGFQQALVNRSSPPRRLPSSSVSSSPLLFAASLKLPRSGVRPDGHSSPRNSIRIAAMDDQDSVDFSSFDGWDDSEVNSEGNSWMISSSEGEDSDTEIVIFPSADTDLPRTSKNVDTSNMDLTVTAHRIVTFHRRHRRRRIQSGVIINLGLITFLMLLLLLVDYCSWRIVRVPFPPFFMTRPFSISAVIASLAGYIFVPVLNSLKIHQVLRKEGPAMHSTKKRTPTMGGLFFVPVGTAVAVTVAGSSSVEVSGAACVTLAFAAIGLLDDILSLVKRHNYGLPARIKFFLQVAVGICFSFWLGSTNISSPYSMKLLVPLPSPLGLVYLGKFYLIFSAFCFVAMGNGINLTDGLDGLAGGTAASAFIGMSIAVLPICSDLAIFGASMAGACVGFLLHNRYKASIFMGDTGSLALGGALAAMAACTGMFFPLFISSGIFVVEVISVIMQVSFFKATKRLCGVGRRLFQMAPLHHHFEMCGFKEPHIVACTYAVSFILGVFAGYVGLISA